MEGSGEEGRGGKGEKNTPWKVAKYSHKNVTLWQAQRLAAAPKPAVFKLKRRPMLFLDRDLMEAPQRDRQKEDDDSGTIASTPLALILSLHAPTSRAVNAVTQRMNMSL